MSKANKHRHNKINSLSLLFLKENFGPFKECPRRNCSGTMTEVWTRYQDHGVLNKELECTLCGKVTKDPRFKKERERRWKQRKKNWHNKRKNNANNK